MILARKKIVIFDREFPLLLPLKALIIGQLVTELIGNKALLGAFSLLLGIQFSLFRRLIIFYTLGAFVVLEQGHSILNSRPGRQQIEGVVTGPIRHKRPSEISFGIILDTNHKILCQAAYLPWRAASRLELGQRVRLELDLIPLNRSKKGFQLSMFRSGYSALGRVKLTKILSESKNPKRKDLTSQISALFKNSENIGLLLAMVLGVRDQISQTTENSFRETGLMHLLVLSGYQLSTVYGVIYLILIKTMGRFEVLRSRTRIDLISHSFSVFGALILALIAGLETSCLRALISLSLMFLGFLMGRKIHRLNLYLSSLLFTQIIWPLSIVYDISLQLTYSALAGLMLTKKGGSLISALLKASFWASLCTTAIILVYFNTIALGGFIWNPILSPFVSLIVVQGGLLAIALFRVGLDPNGYMIGLLVELTGYLKVLVWELGQISFLRSITPSGEIKIVILIVAALLIFRKVQQGCAEIHSKYGY